MEKKNVIRKMPALLMMCDMAFAYCQMDSIVCLSINPPTAYDDSFDMSYLLHRIPDVSFSEKVAGRWVFGKSYEKKGDEWRETTFAVPGEACCDLNPDGSYIFYDKTGGNERKSEGTWAFNVRTKQRCLTIDGQNFDHSFNMPDENTMEIFYSTNADPVTGEIRTGEFKDVMKGATSTN